MDLIKLLQSIKLSFQFSYLCMLLRLMPSFSSAFLHMNWYKLEKIGSQANLDLINTPKYSSVIP